MPVVDLTATYLNVAALLVGVALTLTIQAIQAAVQRRYDRTTKLFDIRLDLYTELIAVMSRAPDLLKKSRALAGDAEELKQIRTAREEVIERVMALSYRANILASAAVGQAFSGATKNFDWEKGFTQDDVQLLRWTIRKELGLK